MSFREFLSPPPPKYELTKKMIQPISSPLQEKKHVKNPPKPKNKKPGQNAPVVKGKKPVSSMYPDPKITKTKQSVKKQSWQNEEQEKK